MNEQEETLEEKANRLRTQIRNVVGQYGTYTKGNTSAYKVGAMVMPHQFWPDGRAKDVYNNLTRAVNMKVYTAEQIKERDTELRRAISEAEKLLEG